MEGIKCEKCGTVNHIGARFCVKCGDKFELSEPLSGGEFVVENPIEKEKTEIVNEDVTFTEVKSNVIEGLENSEKVSKGVTSTNEVYEPVDNKKEENINESKTKKRRISVISIVVITVLTLAIISGVVFGCYLIFKGDIEQIKDSVVMLEIYNDKDEMIATGSGFCVYDSNTIATNFHVVEGAYKIVVVTDDRKEKEVGNVVVFNEKWDLALIQGNFGLVPLTISSNPVLKAGQRVTTIGSPMGELNTVSQGIISNADDDFDIRIDAPISHGSSGGVLLDKQYHVIGVTYAGYDNAQNLNKAINVKYLKELHDAYVNKKYTQITKKNYTEYVGKLEKLDVNGFSKSKIYSPANFDILYKVTDLKSRFEAIIQKDNSPWLTVYNSLSDEAKDMSIATLEYLNSKKFNYNYTAQDVSNWSIEEFFIETLILDKYELAIATAMIQNSSTAEQEFNYINSMPISPGAKMVILQVLSNYEYNYATGSTAETMYNFILDTCPNARDKILELLGFVIEYNEDGTFNTYAN